MSCPNLSTRRGRLRYRFTRIHYRIQEAYWLDWLRYPGLKGRQRAYFDGLALGREDTRKELAQYGNSVPARDAYREGFENGYRAAIRLAEYIVQCPLDEIEAYIENIDIRGRNSFVDDVRASVDAAKRTFDSARSEWSIHYEADHGTAHKGKDH